MDIQKIKSKKQLKEFINKNGSFNQMQINTIKAPDGVNMPEDAKYFKGIASNGDMNRNGYVIEPEAFKNSIKSYMENPVILLQHDANKPIGKCTKAEVTSKGLEVEGYVVKSQMDEASWMAFENGILKGLSTGHITTHAKFKNEETGLIFDEENVGEKGYPGWWEIFTDGVYTMIVDALDWVEFSFVSIPANKKSTITATNATDEERGDAIKKYAINSGKVTEDDLNKDKPEPETVPEEKVETVEETVDAKDPNETEDVVDSENPDEKPEATPDVSEKETVVIEENVEGDAVVSENEEAVEDVVVEEEVASDEPEETDESQNSFAEELHGMTVKLAKNIVKLENDISEKGKALTVEEVDSMINSKFNTVIADHNTLVEKMDSELKKLSNTVDSLTKRLDAVAVNKPKIIHRQFENAQEKKSKSSWA